MWEKVLQVFGTSGSICSSMNTQNTGNISEFFAEIAVVANHKRRSTKTKIEQRGKPAMFVGYANDHTGDVYRYTHLKTQQVIISRDARWMNIMWKAYMRKQQCINHGLQIIDEDLESDDDNEMQGILV